jgi:integrase
VSLYRRGNIWWSRIVRRGERIDRSTKRKNKTDAQRVEARWITQISAAGESLAPLRQTQYPLLLFQFQEKFYAYLDAHCAERTTEFYKQAWAPFAARYAGHITQITPATIEAWVQDRRKVVSATRVNATLRTLRRALRLAEEWKLITKAPKIKLLSGERSREFVITEELLTKMLAHEKCTPLLPVFLPTLIDTGLRISEACALQWPHVGLEPKQSATLGWVYVERGKSKAAKRYVPLTVRAHRILTRLKKASSSKFVFPASDGGQLSRHWASEQFRTLRDALELPDDCVVHSTRHTFCTRLGESGCDAFTIMKLAGHSSIVISQKYVHPTPALLENAIMGLERLQ